MKCKQCGASVPVDAQTCPSCGAKITKRAEHFGTHAAANDQQFNPFFGEDELSIAKDDNPTEEIIKLAFPEDRQPTSSEVDDVHLSFEVVSDDSAKALNEPVDLYGEPTYQQAKLSRPGRKSRVVTTIITLLLVAAVGAAVFVFVLPNLSHTSQPVESRGKTTQNAKQANAPVEANITLQISVPGLDAGGSRVPVHVVGTTIDDEPIDATYYIEADGTGLTLLSGEYTVQLAGSPISAEGALYALPGESVTVGVSTAGVPKVTQQTPWELVELTNEQVTEELIEQARLLAQADPQRKDVADELANRARERVKPAEPEPQPAADENNQTTTASNNNTYNNYNNYNNYNGYTNTDAGTYTGGGTTTYDTDSDYDAGDTGDSGTGGGITPTPSGGDDSGGDDSGGDDSGGNTTPTNGDGTA